MSTDIPVQFKNIVVSCAKCHEDIHQKQFVRSGVTDCSRCHTPYDWKASKFNHDNARFKLDGAHEKVSCEKCHSVSKDKDVNYVNYKNGKLKCIDCHK